MSDFVELVARNVRSESSKEDLIILESDFRRWLDELNILARDVEIQLSAQRARMSQRQVELYQAGSALEWLSYKADEEQWSLGALRFKASVERKIREVKTLRLEKNKVLVEA